MKCRKVHQYRCDIEEWTPNQEGSAHTQLHLMWLLLKGRVHYLWNPWPSKDFHYPTHKLGCRRVPVEFPLQMKLWPVWLLFDQLNTSWPALGRMSFPVTLPMINVSDWTGITCNISCINLVTTRGHFELSRENEIPKINLIISRQWKTLHALLWY